MVLIKLVCGGREGSNQMQTWGLERKWRRLHAGENEPTGTQGTEGVIDGGKAGEPGGSEPRTDEKMCTQVQRETAQDPRRSLNLSQANTVPKAGLCNSEEYTVLSLLLTEYLGN